MGFVTEKTRVPEQKLKSDCIATAQGAFSLHGQLVPQSDGRRLDPRAKIGLGRGLFGGHRETCDQPLRRQVMQEAGVDIAGQQSNTVAELGDVKLDVVITVCGHADENCPVFVGAPRVIARRL